MKLLLRISAILGPWLVVGACAAAPTLSDNDARKVIQDAAGTQYFPILMGAVWIRHPTNERQVADPAKGLYPNGVKKWLETMQSVGLVTYREERPTQQLRPPDTGGLYGPTPYIVVPTEKARQLSEKKNDEYGRMQGKNADLKFTRIVKNVEWRPQRQSADDFRLIVGLYEYNPTAVGKEIREKTHPGDPYKKEYKFRALLKANPFTERFSFVDMDWGYVDRDGWETHTVE